DVAALLARSELFSTLDEDALTVIVKSVRPCSFQRNELVFAEGDPGHELYLVRTGRIAIANKSIDGRESLMALMEEGDLFGEMSFFDGEGRSAQARALEPSELLAVPFAPIREVLEDRPSLLWGVVALLSRRLRTTDAALADPPGDGNEDADRLTPRVVAVLDLLGQVVEPPHHLGLVGGLEANPQPRLHQHGVGPRLGHFGSEGVDHRQLQRRLLGPVAHPAGAKGRRGAMW